jgi:hypothetical protein
MTGMHHHAQLVIGWDPGCFLAISHAGC